MQVLTYARFRAAVLSAAIACTLSLTGCSTGAGNTPAPAVTLSTSTLTFAATVGTPSAVQSFTVLNSGTATLTGLSLSVSSNGGLSQTSTCGSSLAVGATCSVAVTFTPTNPGISTGYVSVNDNASTAPQNVTVVLTATSTTASLSPSSLTFPSTVQGATSAPQVVMLSNTGNGPLTIGSIVAGGSFGATSNCGMTLAAGAICPITVTFTPPSVGALTGTLTVSDNAATTMQAVNLSGTGVVPTAPAGLLSPSSLVFPATSIGSPSAPQTVTLSNPGTAPLTGITIPAPTNPIFSQTTTCGSTLAVGGSCTISVIFTPTTSTNFTGSISVADNAPSAPQVLNLSGSVPYCPPAPATAAPTPPAPTPLAGVAMNVTVMAGTQPVSGASVQLYAAGSTGLGSAPTALLPSALASNSSGAVTIPATYTCSSKTAGLYLVARGGVVGSAAPNAGLTLMTALGPCNQISSGASVVVNEVTTVAATYALSQFMAASGVVGATATNVTGLTNAFATAANLANPATGSTPGISFPANGVSPAPRIASLANLLNACTATLAANSCSQLFAATTAGTLVPSNTLDAMLNLVRSPGNNVAAIYTQSTVSTAFASPLAAAPSDWTLFITYSGGGMTGPSGLGIDSGGNVRVANYFGVASAFSPIGVPLYPTGITGSGLNNSYGLAVDANDNAWIPNEQGPSSVNMGFGSVSVFNLAGTSVAGTTGYSAGGLNFPISVAIDPNTTSWIVDYGNSHVTLLSSTGTPLSGTSGYTTPLFAFPVAAAIDGNHFGWIANQSSNAVTKISPDGSVFTNFNCCNGASGIAVDQQNNVWVANFYGNSISQINSCGAILSNGAYTAGGNVNHPQGVAIDGAGNVWVANYRASYLSEFAGSIAPSPGLALSPSPGYGVDAALLEAYAIALDAAGNIWVSNFGSDTITEFVGMAKPVRTPLLSTPQIP